MKTLELTDNEARILYRYFDDASSEVVNVIESNDDQALFSQDKDLDLWVQIAGKVRKFRKL